MKISTLLAALASSLTAEANYIRARGTFDFAHLELNLSVGNPQKDLSILVDTGSSETWFNPSTTRYDPASSQTYVNTSVPMHVGYMDEGQFDGFMGKERLNFAGNIVNDANIGVAYFPSPSNPQIRPVTGYIGLGLEEGEMVTPRYPNLLSQMRSQGLIRRKAFGVFVDDTSMDDNMYGEVLFGGYDLDRIKGGKLKYITMINHRLNRIKDSPRPYEYDVLITSIMRKGTDLLRRPGSRPRCVETFDAHFDTGYSVIHVPQHVYKGFGADFGVASKNDVISCDVPAKDNIYTFGFNGASVDLPGSAFLMPMYPGSSKCRLLIEPGQKDNRLALGLPFFRDAYVYFDPEGYRIGVAPLNRQATGNPNIVVGTPHYGSSCWINVNSIQKCN